MMTNRYPFNIEWSEDDKEYIATCLAFPGLSAFGETEEEALKEGKIALAGFIETFEAHGMALPEPVVHEGVSGKFQLRLPKSLHRLAIRMAGLESISLNSYIADAVRSKVAGDQVGNRIINEVRHLLARTQTAATLVITAGGQQATRDARVTQNVTEERIVYAATGNHKRGN